MFFRNLLFSVFFLFVVNISSAQTKYLKMSSLIKTYNKKDYKNFLKDSDAFLINNPDYNGTELVVLYQMIITASNETKDFEKTLIYINKILKEFNKNKLDNTWLSKANDFHKEGYKWNKWRKENIDAYKQLRKQIIDGSNSSIAASFTNTDNSEKSITISKNISTTDNNIFVPNLELAFNTKLDSLFNNYEGLYHLDGNNINLLKDKNNLLFETFIDGTALKSKNNTLFDYYLIFRHLDELFLLEIDDSILSNLRYRSTSSLYNFIKDSKEINNLKTNFSEIQRKIYSFFIANKENRLWTYKKGSLILNKKWKKNLKKYYKSVSPYIDNISIENLKVYYKKNYVFDINEIENKKTDFYKIIDLYNRLLKDSDKISPKFENFILDIDNVISKLNLNLSNFVQLKNLSNSNYKNRFYKIDFNEKKDGNYKAFTYIPNLIEESVSKSNYHINSRNLILDKSNKNLTISIGNKFSYSSIDLIKLENSNDIIDIFKNDVLKNADIQSFNSQFNKLISNNENDVKKDNETKYVSENDIKNETRLINVKSTGLGVSIKEAKDNALRSALEETYGIYMSSRTKIKNDMLVDDDIVSLVTGNIDSYSTLSIDTLPNKSFSVLVDAKVNPSKLKNYTKSTGSKIIMDVNSFSRNLKLYETNKSAEEKSIAILCENLNKFIRSSIDFTLKSSDPVYTKDDKTKLIINFKVDWELNDNFKNFEDVLYNTLSNIGMTNDEVIDYIKLGKTYYKFGNIYLRSLKSKNMIFSLLSGLDFYAYNFSLDYNNTSKFPSILKYDNKSGSYKNSLLEEIRSTKVSIGGLVLAYLSDPKRKSDYHKIKNEYITSFYNVVTRYGLSPSNSSLGLYKKNGDIDITVGANLDNDYEYIYDPSATTYSGKHEFELIFTENELKNLNSFVLTNNNSTYKTNNKRSYKKKINKISTKKNEDSVENEATIIGDNIWVRSSPNNGDVIAYLNNGKNVLILGKCCKSTINRKTNDWYKIQFNSQTGWVFGSQLKLIYADKSNGNAVTESYTGLAVTEDDDGWSNVRSGNSTSYSILFKIYAGEKFNILSNDGKWSYIDFNGRKGYIHNSIIRKYNSEQNKKSNSVNTSNTIKNSRNNTSDKFYNSIGSYKTNVTGYYTFDDGNVDDRFKNPNSAFRYSKIQSSSSGWTLFKGMGKFTISFWCQTPNLLSGRDTNLFTLGSTSSQYFRLSGSINYNTDNQSLFLNTKSPGKYFGYNTTNDKFDAFTNGTDWNHYAIVLDNGNFSIYINGSKVGQRKINYSEPYDASILKIGSNRVVFDDVIFFDTSLSSNDIRKLYQNQLYPAN